MISSLSLMIGRRFSRSKKRNKLVSFISMSSTLGIAFGVAVIVIGLSAMNGFERELDNRVLSVIPHGEFEGVEGSIQAWPAMMKKVTSFPQIVAAAPYVRFTALAEKGQQLKAIEVRGIDPEMERHVSELSRYITGQTFTKASPGKHQVILGQGVAQRLGVHVGDALTLMVPNMSGGAKSLKAPQRIRVTLVGVLALHGQIDHNLALIPLEDAQQYTGIGSAVTGVSVKVHDVFRAEQIVHQVGNQLNQYVYLRSWQRQYGYLYRDIQLVRTILYLVMVLVIGVASFNIVSTLMMAVKDRAAEIAILRTMGASDRLIRQIFMWQGIFSGVLGSLCGSVIGVLVATNLTGLIQQLESLIGHHFLSGDIYFVDFLPSQVEVRDVVLVSGTAILLSLAATFYPALKASRLNPATVLSSR
ncbi:lipoprotein-releasing ABC transporter permease subunit LolE [Vibrio gazogenes]|uniref:Lipoprotein-releasing system permease protein n=1 Tax=Vibrio gazogenes DSM 21264 = NBRC 103151 TaxID=1123492 RepID=A0A1M5DUW5_VIBGA|nr:lipoprotein-releasing ABC transporter permease subunit LolE [Vibrio gazogenes]USP14883.1 lipoprotein-releasing ABC transporter permease subunit LolE [Vibrio gazogenes]SHF70803.1 lipoprotein-releasing system permease protein [Vibrio gazogenes DSM 21264] [Vibrio gazogenes DSM 21264 = NBRC 103151]SJN58057.1 Lipoprotein-releasing system transmembrane protein LolE [Vibrio gazogenes]